MTSSTPADMVREAAAHVTTSPRLTPAGVRRVGRGGRWLQSVKISYLKPADIGYILYFMQPSRFQAFFASSRVHLEADFSFFPSLTGLDAWYMAYR